MANEFVTLEFNKIYTKKEFEFPLNLAMSSAYVAANYKGFNLKLFNFNNRSPLCDYALVVSTTNPMQSKAIVEEIMFNAKKNGSHQVSLEGMEDMNWILLDLGDIIIHVFQEHAREIYDLDTLWATIPQVKIPDEYYFASSSSEIEKEDPTENYF